MAFFPLEKFNDNSEIVLQSFCDNEKIIAILKYYDKIYEYVYAIDENVFDYFRIAIKRSVYEVLSQATGIKLPWGLLTGIKPALFYDEISKHCENADEFFAKHLLVSDEKIQLCKNVSENRKKLIEKSDENKNLIDLYISIPFCPSRCSYCSFVSASTEKERKLIEPYLKSLINEMKQKSEFIKQNNMQIHTVYIGGGTPSVLSENELIVLFNGIKDSFNIYNVIEFTFEAGRPDTITEEKLNILKSFGVNRISVNPQTLDDRILEKIGRKHTVKDFYTAFNLAYKQKFCVNVDLIAGLPNDNTQNFIKNFEKIIDLNPQNITIHTLYIKRAADYGYINRTEMSAYAKENETVGESLRQAYEICKQNAYHPYYLYRQKNTVGNFENIGYAKKGYECHYNVYMMDDVRTVVGIGANAVTKIINSEKPERIYNKKYPIDYIKEY